MASRYIERSKVEKYYALKIDAPKLQQLHGMTKEEILDFVKREFYFDEYHEALRTRLQGYIGRKRKISNEDRLPAMPKITIVGGVFYITYFDYKEKYTKKKSLNIDFQVAGLNLNITNFKKNLSWMDHPKANQLEIEVLTQFQTTINQRISFRAIYNAISSDEPMYLKNEGKIIDQTYYHIFLQTKYTTEEEALELAKLSHRLMYLHSKQTWVEVYERMGKVWDDPMPAYLPYDATNFKSPRSRMFYYLRNPTFPELEKQTKRK
jgi:hypothetical protein